MMMAIAARNPEASAAILSGGTFYLEGEEHVKPPVLFFSLH